MKNLQEVYNNWRKVSEQMLEDGFNGSVDCGEKSTREDFSNYAELDEEISFEDMLELESNYTDLENLEGKKWGDLTNKEKEILLKNAHTIDGITTNEVNEGECIVDFYNSDYSIAGNVIDDEIVIDDSAEFYNPTL